jgi:hypothetical protein
VKGFAVTHNPSDALRSPMDCAYCDSAVEEHDPVYVSEGAVDADPMPFCNYACLTSYVDKRGLTDGASCNWSPE